MHLLKKNLLQAKIGTLVYTKQLSFCIIIGLRGSSFGIVQYEKGKQIEELLQNTKIYFVPFEHIQVVRLDFIEHDRMISAFIKLRMLQKIPSNLLDEWDLEKQIGYSLKKMSELQEHDIISLRSFDTTVNVEVKKYVLEKEGNGLKTRYYRNNGVEIKTKEDISLKIKPDVCVLVPETELYRSTKESTPVRINADKLQFDANYYGLTSAILQSLPDDRVFDFILKDLCHNSALRPCDMIFVYPDCKKRLIEQIRKEHPFDKNALYEYLSSTANVKKGLYGYIVTFAGLNYDRFYIARKSDYERLLHTMEYIFLTAYKGYS